ncbi:MAG TPA: hypothetical protein VMV72_08390 [Verrucomicrobiae bacterium]|nr:hypothetical protein [Verrucomicrobiae bacterium]
MPVLPSPPATNLPYDRLAVLLTPTGEKWPHLAPPTLTHLADWR